MRAFAEAYSDQEFVQQVVAQLPRGHQVGGRYFEDCNEAEPNRPGSRRGVATYALDPEAAARLWQVSLDMLAS